MNKKIYKEPISNEELLLLMETIEITLVNNVMPTIKDLEKEIGDSTVLSDNIIFGPLELKDDKDFYSRLLNVCEKYLKSIPELKITISEDISDNVSFTTNNLNNKILLAVISEGIFLSENLVNVLTYIMSKFYSEDTSGVIESINRDAGRDLLALIKFIPEFEKSDFESIVKTIGNIPVIKTLRHEETSTIPTEVIMSFFTNKFKIKDENTLNFINKFINMFDNSEEDIHLSKTFIGNPILHFRLLLVDIDILRAEYHKSRVKLLELRILELKTKGDNAKAIKYYEDKVNKLRLKISRLVEV